MRKTILLALALAISPAFAQPAAPAKPATAGPHASSAGTLVGLGQDSAREPAKIRNLRLSDPLVQQKYLNEPDMLRFLRGTYAEACTRGTVVNATKQVQANLKKEYPPEAREIAGRLLESNRIWKMSSFEMEALVGEGYLIAANYCDCLMKEIPDADLVNPRKGLEVMDALTQPVRDACQVNAEGLAATQMAARKKREAETKASKK